MIEANLLIETAKKLLLGSPTQSDLRRSVSTAYYALFHHICRHFSSIVLQPNVGSYDRARLQAYRHLDHGPARQRCQEAIAKDRNFPIGIVKFADAFVELQQRRLEADYDPSTVFSEIDTRTLVEAAQDVITWFDLESEEARRAFVLFVGLRPKNR